MGLKDEVLEKIIERASVIFKKDRGELNADTRFVEDMKAKSANVVQIITILEDTFDVEVPLMEIRRKKTFGEAAEFIAQLCGE